MQTLPEPALGVDSCEVTSRQASALEPFPGPVFDPLVIRRPIVVAGTNMASLVGDGLGLLRSDGPAAFFRSATSVGSTRLSLLARYYGRLASYHLRSPAARAHPWRPLAVDPFEIEFTNKAAPIHGAENVTAFDSIDDAGRVVGGDWDREVRVRFEQMPKVRSVRRRFEDGVPWEETEVWANLVAAIDDRGSIDGCRNRRELRRRYREIDALYRSIAAHGFLPRSAFASWHDVDRRLDLPKVNVGRDGTLIKAKGSGYHRIAIARVLEIPVPVRVLVRHAEWQRTREAYARADTIDDVRPERRRFATHPDVLDVTPTPSVVSPSPDGEPAKGWYGGAVRRGGRP